MCRKYQRFNIKVTYLNDDTETIKYSNSDESNYKQMLELYKQTRDSFKDDCVTIDFLGTTESGDIGVLFRKEIINEEELKIKEEADIVENVTTEKLLDQLYSLVNILENKRIKCEEKIPLLNKKQDIILHKAEHIDKAIFPNEEKIKLINDLHAIRTERRIAKNDEKVLNEFRKNQNIQALKDAILKAKQINYDIKLHGNNVEYLTNDKIEKFKIMKEIKYKNYKERINLVKQLEPKYGKVYYDDSKMILTCYNKAR